MTIDMITFGLSIVLTCLFMICAAAGVIVSFVITPISMFLAALGRYKDE